MVEPMRHMVVPQSGHLPFVMGLPFFVTLSTGSCMTFFALHFTQYASIAILTSNVIRGIAPFHRQCTPFSNADNDTLFRPLPLWNLR